MPAVGPRSEKLRRGDAFLSMRVHPGVFLQAHATGALLTAKCISEWMALGKHATLLHLSSPLKETKEELGVTQGPLPQEKPTEKKRMIKWKYGSDEGCQLTR